MQTIVHASTAGVLERPIDVGRVALPFGRSEQLEASVWEGAIPHLNEYQLAKRWQVSVKKLQKDRLTGEGIPFLRIGRSIRYRMSDVLAFEEANMMTSTSAVLALPAPSLPAKKAGNRRKGR